MGRFLLADPTAGVLKLPQPFRMIDKILSGIVDDASDRGMARDLRRLARLGILEGTFLYDPVVTTAELDAAAKCVCVASVSGRDSDEDEDIDERVDVLKAHADGDDDDQETSSVKTSSVKKVVFAGDENGGVLAVDAATGVVLGAVSAFQGQAVTAIATVTVAPPCPEDDKFWRGEIAAAAKDDAGGDGEGETAEGDGDGEATADDAPAADGDAKNADDQPAMPLFDIAAAAGGPSPRDTRPVMLVVAACATSWRAYVFDPSASSKKMWSPLCAGVTPYGSTPTQLRLSMDGRHLALGGGGGAVAAFEMPPPKRSAFLPSEEEKDATDADEKVAASVNGDEAKDGETPEEETPGDGDVAETSTTTSETHDCSLFPPATVLVWVTAANAAIAFGVEPLAVDNEISSGPPLEGKGADEGASPILQDALDAAETGEDVAKEKEGTDARNAEGDDGAALTRGAPDLHFRFTAKKEKADALLVAWRGCNRAVMFALGGGLDVLDATQHRHDSAPQLRGEGDRKKTTRTEDGDDDKTDDKKEEDAATPSPSVAPISAKYSTPACDWTTPFPITSSASSASGAYFALGLVDGTVLLFDTRLATTRARLDRLGAVKARASFRSPALIDDDVSVRDENITKDAPYVPVTSLTSCAALAFREEAGKTYLVAASDEGWSVTFDLDAEIKNQNQKAKRPIKTLQPRGDPHVARSISCQRDGVFALVEGDAPDTRRRASGAEEWDDDDDDDQNAGDSNRNKSNSSTTKKTFVRLLDMTGVHDLYGVLSLPVSCEFAVGTGGRTAVGFDGAGTVVIVATERRTVAVETAETPLVAEKGQTNQDDADGETESNGEKESEPTPAPPAVTHTTHAKLCVYRVPNKIGEIGGQLFNEKNRPETPNAAFPETGRFFSETTASEKPAPAALTHELDLSQPARVSNRLARILNTRGGPDARAERFQKRIVELERKFERQALAEGGQPAAALVVLIG